MTAYSRVYDSRHLQADCQEPGSAPEPYARQSSMGYLYLLPIGRCQVISQQNRSLWPGAVMVRMLARDTKGRGFDSRPFRLQVTTLGNLFTHMCLCCQQTV